VPISGVIRTSIAVLVAACLMKAGVVVAMRSEAPTLVARDAAQLVPPQELRCAPGEMVAAAIDHPMDIPGGPASASEAMEEWLSRNGDLTLDDVVAVDREASSPVRADYEYRTDEGFTIASFHVNRIGESWAVSGWQSCDEQIRAVIRIEEEG
jgi:hypothetical protein